jgi:molybdate transport system substrate-binding protein
MPTSRPIETAFQVAHLKILSTHAALEVLSELGPQFERATNHTLSFSYDPANTIKRQIEDGASFDVAIVTRPVLDDLVKQNKIVSSTSVDIGRSRLGVAIREGTHKPAIGTVDEFKRALLSAKSIVRSAEGTSGVYFDLLLNRLGIADEMRGKIILGPSGRVAELVAKGDVDMAVQQISELLPVQGVQFVGPFPSELQLHTVFSAGIGTGSKNLDAAERFLRSLTTSAAIALFTAHGLEPITR